MSSTHPITRLVARYGAEHGMYLYGEYCLLLELGYEAFRRRHTDDQLKLLEQQLGPLSLWPSEHGPGREEDPSHDPRQREREALDKVALSLVYPPLALGLGVDLFRACVAWAGSQGDKQADPGAWFEPSRQALGQSLGFILPPMHVQLDAGAPAHVYRLYVRGEVVAEGEAFPGLDLMKAQSGEAAPAQPYPWSRDPAGRGWVTWLPIGPGATPPPHLERLHWIAAMNRHVTAALPRFADRLLTVPVVHWLLEQAEVKGYDHELERYASVPELRLVFATLVRQGLQLEPAPMLEILLTALMKDLAGRSLPPSELERLARQLPVFSTRRLVGLVRSGLGLSEEPGPRLDLGGEPAPEPMPRPEVSAEDEARWRELHARVAETRGTIEACLHVLRTLIPLAWQRGGFGVRWSMTYPRAQRSRPIEPDLAARLLASGRLPVLQRVIERELELAGRLEELVAWLAAPESRRLSAPAALMAAAPCWPEYAWTLAAPGRMLDELDLRGWATQQGFIQAGI